MNGIINVYKEAGYTSHDVVARLRRILSIKRIGHTGTLDPAAEGVLPVCVGRSTVLADIIADGKKVYEAVLLLGVKTDTCDLEGRVLEKKEVLCTGNEVCECIKRFIGEQEQMPPMYSAVKIGGKKLYELARKGIEVERKPRKITVFGIDVKKTELPEVTMEITCSKGTYIRSLCSDIGDALGCGGCMAKLIRKQAGIFKADRACRIDDIKTAAENGMLENILISPDDFFPELLKVKTAENADRLVYNGNSVSMKDLVFEETGNESTGTLSGTEMFRLYDSRGRFIGLFGKNRDRLEPFKMLYDF